MSAPRTEDTGARPRAAMPRRLLLLFALVAAGVLFVILWTQGDGPVVEPAATPPDSGAVGAVGAAPQPRTASRVGLAEPLPEPPASARVRTAQSPPPDPGLVLLRATLVEPTGAPCRRTYVSFQLLLAAGDESFDLQQTDADGVYQWSVGSALARVRPVQQARYTIRPWTADALEARVPIARVLVPGVNDLGVVVLRPPAAVVSGVVVDELGASHPLAELELWLPARPPESAHATTADGRGWSRPWPSIRSSADAQGAFVVRGEWPADELALLPRPKEAPAGPLTAARRGDLDLRLVVARGASVAGRLLLDDVAAAVHFHVRVLRAGTGGEDSVAGEAQPEADGRFRITRLAPGGVVVAVFRGGQPAPVHRVADVVLVAGETCRDPRLQALDVRAGEQAFTVEVLRLDRKPVWGAEVVVSTDRGRVTSDRTGRNGKVRLVVPRLPVDLLVYDPSSMGDDAFAALAVRGVAGDRTVVVSPGPLVRVRILGEPQLPEGMQLVPQLFIKSGTAPDGHTPVTDLFPRLGMVTGFGTLRGGEPFRVPMAATYAAYLMLRAVSGQVVHLDEPRDLVVVEGTGEQVFELTPSAATVARAVKILAGR